MVQPPWRIGWKLLIKLNIPYPLVQQFLNTCITPQKDLYVNVHSSFIPNSLNPEKAEYFTKSRINKQIVIYSYNGILLSNEREQIPDTWNNVGECQKCCVKDAREGLPWWRSG